MHLTEDNRPVYYAAGRDEWKANKPYKRACGYALPILDHSEKQLNPKIDCVKSRMTPSS
jgi:hypothetical protein